MTPIPHCDLIRAMIRNIAMLVLCFVVVGAMAGVLRWFLSRLNKIEVEMWGEKARLVSEAKKRPHAS